jgi:hypothetical protein
MSKGVLEIRKPTRGAYVTSNFGNNWCSPETLARTERDIYLDDELIGMAEYDDGSWWIDLEIDGKCLPQLELQGGMRSQRRALEQIARHIELHT